MQTVSSPTQGPSFRLAEPLDWFQLRALLWEGVDGRLDWSEVPAFLAERCPRSSPVDAATCRRVYEQIVDALPVSDSVPRSGPALWTELLYSSVHGLFPMTPVFMNLGYLGEVEGLSLEPEDQPLYPFAALYRCALEGIELAGRDVVDVGAGAGGGCWHMLRYLAPRSVTGVDLVEANVAAATRAFRDDRLCFVRGDAERLPLPPARADVVVSIESSHCYRSFPAFLAEVRRVLRPGGMFALADHRPSTSEWGEGRSFEDLLRDLDGSSLTLLRQRQITPQVVASCELLADFKEQMLRDAPLSDADRSHLREILHCRDSDNHRKLRDGHWSYGCFTLLKSAD